jgi:hypothetical protein
VRLGSPEWLPRQEVFAEASKTAPAGGEGSLSPSHYLKGSPCAGEEVDDRIVQLVARDGVDYRPQDDARRVDPVLDRIVVHALGKRGVLSNCDQ